jgi:hypothetical protein
MGSFDKARCKRLLWDGTGLILGALWWLKWAFLALAIALIAILILKYY